MAGPDEDIAYNGECSAIYRSDPGVLGMAAFSILQGVQKVSGPLPWFRKIGECWFTNLQLEYEAHIHRFSSNVTHELFKPCEYELHNPTGSW